LVLCFFALAGMIVSGQMRAHAAASYVTSSGSNLMYQSSRIVLRGVNFNNEPALACCGGPNINSINVNQTDYARAHSLGANHVRWGLDYNWYSSNKTQFFSVLDQHLAWAAQNQLWVYLNDFIPPGGSSGGFDQSAAHGYCIWSDCGSSANNQTLLNNMWQDIATRYANNPTVVGYDLMNEPNPPADSQWHAFATRMYNTITAADPNHLVIIEAPLSNDLSLFSQNTRVVYEVHHYPGGDNFPNQTPANTPMLVGEFGDRKSSSTAVSFVSSEITRYNAAGASWTFFVWREDPSGFGLYSSWGAGDFSVPWNAMITTTQTGWAGNVMPAASGGTPSPTPTPSPPPVPSAGVPAYDHVFEILMENTAYSQIIGSPSAPYVNSLAGNGAIAGNYVAIGHPSLPNYMALSSGQSYSWAPSDCDPSASCQTSAVNVADRIEGSGKTWREYAESMGSPCRLASAGTYFARHNPFVYYTDITGNATRCNSHVVDYSNLSTDLASTSSTPNYAFITPNSCNDMHDCPVATGDTWLSQAVPAILGSPAFTQQHSLLVIVWDEDDGSQGNKVAFVATGYGVKTGFTSNVGYNHYSLLRTVEASWGLSTMTTNDAAASAMSDIFGTSPAPLTATATASRSAATAPAAVTFTGTASGGTSPFTFAWTFGDGGTSTSQSPSHTYTTAGAYTASLTVSDSAGHTATASAPSVTISPALTATAGGTPASGVAPLPVTFTGSPAGGRTPYTYAWAFGDGGTSTLQSPSHSYATAGIYGAGLTVTDANGATATATTITTSVSGPLAATAAASPAAGDAPFSTTLTGAATGGNTPYTFAWDLGDGATSAVQSPGHTYSAAGTYTATLTVRDSSGQTSTATARVIVSPSLGATSSATPTSGDAPLAVAFTGGSTGGLAPFSYTWTFGDGSTSASLSPSHTYSAAGTYTAGFSVTDANRMKVSATAITIVVQPHLNVTDSGLPTAGEAPLTVAFTSAPTGGTLGYSYAWTFGDGGTSTSQNPNHTYTAVGTYTARLTVTDAIGATAGATAVTITVNPPPTATASAAKTAGDAPLAVSFTGAASSGTAPYGYAWTFGDGGTSASQSPSHTYTTAGTYQATLTVTDAAGRNASATTASITVSPALTATSSASPTSGTAPLAVAFTASPGGGLAPYTYAWTFGDGTSSTLQSPSHTYGAAGTFSATLAVTDANGAKVSPAAIALAVNGPLAATAKASPTAGDAPALTSLTGSAAGGKAPYTFAWTFGDGTTSTQQSPTHTYTAAGSYTATLTVHDSSAQTATATATIVVAPALGASSSASNNNGDAPLAVAFTGSAAGGIAPYSYAWAFGDGSSSSLQNPGHTYGSAGDYSAVLTVTDGNGVKATATHLAIVVHGPLAAASSASPAVGDAPFATTLAATPSAGTAPYTFAWTFGDGATSTSQNPSHTYTAAGTYSARLTVTDAVGATANAPALTITVNPPPAATASAGVRAGDAPVAVTFTGGASSGTTPYTYSWAFGDGGTSASQNPGHTYTAAGTYDAVLTITDAAGKSASAPAVTMTISPAFSAAATALPSSGSSPLAVTLTGTPSGGAAPYSYAWTLGDGATSNVANPSHTYAAGTYTALVAITDANGVKALATAPAIISIGPLVAGANATPAVGDAPLATRLTGSATGGKAPLTYTWDFGDGTTGTQQSPSHTYSVAGTYTATETISDGSGQVSHATAAVTVYPGLTVSASVTPTSGAAPLGVSFAVTVGGGLPPYTLDWDYGDGVAGTGVSATHTYAAGTFHPKLTLHDAAGGGWSQGVGTITSTGAAPVNPPAVNPPAGSQAGPPADATPSASPSASPATSPSPSPSTGPAAPSAPQPNPGGANPVLLLLGGVLATGLGGAVFVGWLRRRGV